MVWLVKGITGDRRHPNGRTALEILEERFARDEISREEYEEKKKVLT
ncbi:MAG: SHOCT domain-containing protein [Pseudomonadota bacterium]